MSLGDAPGQLSFLQQLCDPGCFRCVAWLSAVAGGCCGGTVVCLLDEESLVTAHISSAQSFTWPCLLQGNAVLLCLGSEIGEP